MKKTDDAVKIARYISEFLDVYAPNFLTTSEHTLKSYRNALGLYITFSKQSLLLRETFPETALNERK